MPCILRRRLERLLSLLAAWAALGLWHAPAAAQLPVQVARPTLMGHAPDGTAIDLLQLRGRVVLLFFWSTECPVCMDKLAELRRNLDGWRDKDFVIVAVSQDRSAADLRDYLRVLERMTPPRPQMKIVWRRDPAHRDSFGELPANSPTSIILDKTGAVAKVHRGRVPPEAWDEIAELVLN